MPFALGDDVHIAALGTGVVREVRKGGRYLVELQGRALLVDEAKLTPISERKRRSKPAPAASGASPDPADPRANTCATLDLHGMTVLEATTAVDTFLSEAILAGHAEVRVIHGRSGGRLKAALHALLNGLPVVRAFRIDPANPGVTIVCF